jgi:hypothetical protein
MGVMLPALLTRDTPREVLRTLWTPPLPLNCGSEHFGYTQAVLML